MSHKNVVELIRVSTKAQADEDRAGIPAQKTANRRTASTYGLEIVRTIAIADVSGAAVLKCSEMQELLKLIEDSHIHGVVAKEFSRVMRPENFSDYVMLQAFADSRTVLYLPDGPVDFNSKSGRLLGGIRALMAGNEISEMRERSWDAKEEKRRAGKFPQSAVCLPNDVAYSEERGWYYKPEAERMREAFRLFLSGDTSYSSIGSQVGIDPFTLRKKLRNSLYAGWRVIDERRDPSAGARRVKADGRQGDRPKIKRAESEVIRVQVISEPLVSFEDFQTVQAIMNTKAKRHWRTRTDYQHKYTYNGFLSCSTCGDLIYTHFRRADYYVCKKRKLRKNCEASYMRRDRLEPELDSLFSRRLSDKGFLREVAHEMRERSEIDAGADRAAKLLDEIERLKGKRERVLEAFFDGVLDASERDARVRKLDEERETVRAMLDRERPAPEITSGRLAQVFGVFREFEFLGRDDKRRLLSTLAPDVRVADYRIDGFSVLLPIERGDEITHTAADYLIATRRVYLPLGI